MNIIIKKSHRKELELITASPVYGTPKRVKKARIRDKLWAAQSRSVKTKIIVLFLLLAAGSVHYYNQFITESFYVRLATAQIEAEIQRKNFIIPDLTQVVEEYMRYEGKVFVHAADVKNALAPFTELASDGITHPMEMKTPADFKTAISKFQAVAESYPELKSSEAYRKLMLQLANTETRLTDARNRYNIAVNQYNTSLELLPGGLFGYILGFKPVKIDHQSAKTS